MHETHTPGPWIYKGTAGQHDYAVYAEATGRDVALVRDFDEANARLIAAAPDLLAACSYALTGLLANGDRDEETIAMCHRLDRVLMQARTVPPIVCATCGEEAGSTGSLSGLVHRWGPVDHPFIPRKD